MIFPSVDALSIGDDKYLGVVFKDEFGNMVTTGSGYALQIYNKMNRSIDLLLEIDSNNNKNDYLRLLNAIDEIVYIASWVNEEDFGVPEYAFFKLYKYNLQKSVVEIFDSYDLGIIMNGVDEVEKYFPTYDISKDKKFFYIPARNDIEYTNAETFKRDKVKFNGALYVYDWWENKLFKFRTRLLSK